MKLKVEYIPTETVDPYPGNAKLHPAEQVEQIKKSIQDFGFNDPVAIWKNNEIIEGHGRVIAALELGIKDIPVIRLDDLSDDERRAYMLVHNQLTMNTGFDYDLLELELEDLEALDLTDFGLELKPFEPPADVHDDDFSYYGDERERTFKSTNFDMFDVIRTEGFYEMPSLEAVDYIPKKLVGFNYAKTSSDYDACIHFYLDDYQFERVWNEPERYIEMLANFDATMTPNFSIYLDYPESVKIWNTYRARLIGQAMQDAGLTVVPIVYWSNEKSYSYCFDGLPENGTLSVNNIGNKTEESRQLWAAGMDELIARKSPKRIILYSNGVDPGYDFGDIEVIQFTNSVTERLKGSKNG